MGSSVGISDRAWGKIERGETKSLSFSDIEKLLLNTQIDARWLFGQIQGPIEEADLRLRGPEKALTQQLLEEVQELRKRTRPLKELHPLAEKVLTDLELRRLVEKLVARRQYFGRIEGYIDGLVEEEKGGEKQAREA